MRGSMPAASRRQLGIAGVLAVALAVLAVVGCSQARPPAVSTSVRAATAGAAAPDLPTLSAAGRAGPLDVAAPYAGAACVFSWGEPHRIWEHRQDAYFSASAQERGRTRAADGTVWGMAVVPDQRTSRCIVVARRIFREAPATGARRQLRMVARRTLVNAHSHRG